MRSYSINSPQAAGRVLALMMISDGNVSAAEVAVLSQLGAEQQLGLPEGGLGVVLRDLCEDLLMAGHHGGSLLDGLDETTIKSVMDEVTDPYLRNQVFMLAKAIACADHHWAEGEIVVLDAACRHWEMSPAKLARAGMLA